MILIRGLAFLLHFTLVPIAVGRLITYKARTNWIADYLVGFFGNLAIFYTLFTIVEWLQNWCTVQEPVHGAFSLLLWVYGIVMAILGCVWLVFDIRKYKRVYTKIRFKLADTKLKVKKDKFVIVYAITFAILLLIQLYGAFAYEINEWSYDDYDYVVTSKDTIESDTISYVNYIDGTMPNVQEKRAVASWGTYVAMLSATTGFEVTTVYHTILPLFLLLLAYAVFYYIAGFLFHSYADRFIFLIILSVAHIFGLYSHYSITFRLLGALWQGKAILCVIAIPFFMLYLIKAYKREVKTAYMLPIAAISIGASSLTSLSVLFIPIIAVLVWIMMCVYHRKIFGIRYLIASLLGPLYVGIFYILIWMLQQDMKTSENKFFESRIEKQWVLKWFH